MLNVTIAYDCNRCLYGTPFNKPNHINKNTSSTQFKNAFSNRTILLNCWLVHVDRLIEWKI